MNLSIDSASPMNRHVAKLSVHTVYSRQKKNNKKHNKNDQGNRHIKQKSSACQEFRLYHRE